MVLLREDLERIRARHCQRKHKFETRSVAEAEVVRLKSKYGPLRTLTLRPYGPCFFCGYWHIGRSHLKYGHRSLRRKMTLPKRPREKPIVVLPKQTARRRHASAVTALRRKAGVA